MKTNFSAIRDDLDIIAAPESRAVGAIYGALALADTVWLALDVPAMVQGTINNASEAILPFNLAVAVGAGYLAIRNFVLRHQDKTGEQPPNP